MKQYKNICLIAIIAMISVLSSVNAQSLYFKKKDGTQTSYIIDNIAKLTFEPGYVTLVQTSGNQDEFELSQIKYLSFQNYTSIEIPQKRFSINDFVIYPNPVNDVINFQNPFETGASFYIQIVSIEGSILITKSVIVTNDNLNYQIDVSSLSQGMYLFKVYDGKSLITTKFVK